MNNELKPYESYKNAGLLWLDKVPSHWAVVGNKELWAERSTKNCINEELLSVTIKKGVIKQEDLIKNSSKKDSSNINKSNYKLVMPNDIAYNKMRMWQGAVGKSKYRGIVSPAYIILKPIKDINTDYFHYILRTLDYIEESHRYSYGICDDQLNLRYEDFKRMKNVLPPPKEQDQIVKYLDSQLAKINKFIKAKKKLIAVLKERKQVVINEAVTKGINPYVKMKPSGIEWLGDIPEHWGGRRCKFLFCEVNERSEDGNETHLSMSQKHGLVPNDELEERRLLSENYIGAKICKKDDLVLNRLKAHLGVFALSLQTGLVSSDYTVLRPNELIYPKFGRYVLISQACRGELCRRVKGIVMGFWRLYTDDFYNIVLPLPTYDEQKSIVNALEEKFNRIDIIISKAQQEINLITEYRTRLISDVVTGKLDVRNVVIDDIVSEDAELEELDEEIQDNEELADSEDGEE